MKKNSFDTSIFVGTDENTRKYQRKYVGYFHPGQRVLDIGCGRGVFLEVLRDAGMKGIGVEAAAEKVAECRNKNLEVHRADAILFLKKRSSRYHGIFCSHFVEHLPPPTVLEFMRLAHRGLEEDGLLIIITPNFKNIDVIAERFWLDISHVRPYPTPLLEKMVESAGFTVIASGIDRATNQRFPKRKPWLGLEYALNKIRFGKFFGKGDSFVIARKA